MDRPIFEIDPYQYESGKWWGRIEFRYQTTRATVTMIVTPVRADFPDDADGFDTDEDVKAAFSRRAWEIVETNDYPMPG